MQTWWSGTSVSARRPERGPESSTIVPVSAIASAEPVTTASSVSSSAIDERVVVDHVDAEVGERRRDADPRGAGEDASRTVAATSAAATRWTVAWYSATRSQNRSTIPSRGSEPAAR